ncbi:MAG TPA: sigma-70 family RNA polymerase sigma factor [Planctomycetota bacterium]|nr:sigma-70 family RNA polymerase sigma factor [Planctomycetota bacterium]
MTDATPEDLFARYRAAGDVQALAAVFDRLAPELLLVAAHLAHDGGAEDLVQATFLDAMRHADRWDPARRLAPWLVGLLGNHLREARRQRQRVPDAERLEPRAEQRPDAVAEANESLDAVHAAVAQLPRPYRQVLSLRLVHGLELQQIAHSLDAPLGTVKVRLHRGMVLLRRALPAGLAPALAVLLSPGRGLAAVRQVVLGSTGVAAGAAAATGLLVGGFVVKQFLAVVVAAVVLVGTWWAFDASPAGNATAPVARQADAAMAAPEPAPKADAPVAAAAAPAEQAAPAVVRETAPTTGALDVQVVWASDREPAPFLDVMVYRREPRMRATRRADARGRVTFDGLASGSYRVATPMGLTPEPVSVEVVAGETHACELAASGDQRLLVPVVDDADRPQPGADVWCLDLDAANGGAAVLGRTDATGTLGYRGLPLSSIWARRAGCQPSLTHELPRTRPGEAPAASAEVRLVLGGAGCSVLGSVVDPDRHPVADARVLIACEDRMLTGPHRTELTLTTDAAGRFACDEVPAGERYIVGDAPGLAPTVERITTSADQPATIVLALQKGACLTGRVTDAGGAPIAGVSVTASKSRLLPGLGSSRSWGWQRETRTDDDGHYRLDAILPGETNARALVEPAAQQQFPLADGEQRTWDVTKAPERAIHGIVLDQAGEPLARWFVRAMPSVPVRDQRLGATDAKGAFRIAGLEDVPHRVFVFAQIDARGGAAAMVPRAVLEDVRPSTEPLTVRLDGPATASGWIEGSIAMPDGVEAKAELSLYAKILRRGAFTVPQQKLEAGETTFRIGPLPAGEYDLLCDIEGRGRLQHRGLRLGVDETLRLPPFAADAQRPLAVALRLPDGRPATGAKVVLKQTLEPCAESEPGLYGSRPIEAGSYDVSVRGPGFAPATFAVQFAGGGAPVEHTVALAPTVEICCKPATPRERWIGAMQIHLTDAGGAEVVKDFLGIDGKPDFVWSIGLLPGTYSLRCSAFNDGSATTTFTAGTAPQRVELQFAK